MKKRLVAALALCLLALSCSGQGEKDWLGEDWAAIEKAAKGTTVTFAMYGGFAHVNQWIDNWVTPEMEKRYGVHLNRVPMDAGVFVNKLLAEKGAGKTDGNMDLLWINGENFKNAKSAGLLFGPYADKCPNYQLVVDKELASQDFGYPTDGYETPYGMAQFVFEYDPARGTVPPRSFAELAQWVKANPGAFTYPQPPDFTGSAFIRQAFYAVTGGVDQYTGGFDQTLYEQNAPKLWAWLNELKPYLWQQGRAYPKSSAALDTLFGRGEVELGMSYHPMHAQSKVLEGGYPESTRTFTMKEGSIFNLHFTAIPFNSQNKPAAMVTANFLMSPAAQLSKLKPGNWGDFPAIDRAKLDEQTKKAFSQVDLGASTLSPDTLADSAVPEVAAQYVEALENDWEEQVLR